MGKEESEKQELYKQALSWIIKTLQRNKIKFNIIGGLASHAYGSKIRFNDIDLSMNLRDMKKLERLKKDYVIVRPWNGTSSNNIWKGYIMKLNYNGITIEITESENTKIFNKKSGKWEKFPAGLKNSVIKNILGLKVPVMPKENLIDYKSKLGFPNDKLDLKHLISKR